MALLDLVKEGSIIPSEVSFLDFVVDEEVEKFWLKPSKNLQEVRKARIISPKSGSS